MLVEGMVGRHAIAYRLPDAPLSHHAQIALPHRVEGLAHRCALLLSMHQPRIGADEAERLALQIEVAIPHSDKVEYLRMDEAIVEVEISIGYNRTGQDEGYKNEWSQ